MCKFSEKGSTCKYELRFPTEELPRDIEGFCIFHSPNLVWKKSNGFREYILRLAQSYISNKGLHFADFGGIVFDSCINELIEIDFKNKNLALDNCIIHSDVRVENKIFEGSLSLKGSIIHGKMSFLKTTVDGVDLKGIIIKGFLELKDVHSKSYFYLEKANIHGALLFLKATFAHAFSVREAKINSDLNFPEHTHINNVQFLMDADFTDTHFKNAFVLTNTVVGNKMVFDNTLFECDLFSPIFSAIHISYITIENSGSIRFQGNEKAKIFDISSDVVIEQIDIKGELIFEYCNLQKLEIISRQALIRESKKENPKVRIGRGCLKYKNQSPIRTVIVNEANQNLVIDLCNTFSKFFKSSTGFNLGLEITERTDTQIKYFYFSDEPISYETFLKRLQAEKINMWSLVKIDNQVIVKNEKKTDSISNTLVSTTDTVIDLIAIILKIIARVPVLRLSHKEINNILNSSSVSGAKVIDYTAISEININQNILLGIGNTQSNKLS